MILTLILVILDVIWFVASFTLLVMSIFGDRSYIIINLLLLLLSPIGFIIISIGILSTVMHFIFEYIPSLWRK